ncbi:MAG TPA: DUF1800 domain-containing protein [Ramlibacter sp.]|nr:DUF1800 domain-containing protein [Ramlibacter sp.]
MHTPASIALNRFGLGARADEAVPSDPAGWLLGQFERYQATAPAWAGVQGGKSLLAAYQLQQQAVQRATDEADRVAAQQALRQSVRGDYLEAVAARTIAALETPAPFVERLVHFWANHFAVSVEKPAVTNLAGAFEAEAIRPHVLGRFEDLLLAAVRHPAMLLYLDQANSIGPDSPLGQRLAQRNPERARGLNENLAREILELHTVGVRSGYTQADVTEFARALTGWSVTVPAANPAARLPAEEGAHGYAWRPAQHQPGTRTVLGRGYAQSGEQQALAVLKDVAAAPATARHVAFKLARHFTADEPPPALVQRLSDAFQRSGGDLPTVYRVLVQSREAWAGHGKFKSPWDWALSSLRGLDRREVRGAQMAGLMQQLGQPVWRPGSPAGHDDVGASWAAPDALLRRVESAQRLAAQAADRADARLLGPRLLPGALSEATAAAVSRAESQMSAVALLLVSPEFLRR